MDFKQIQEYISADLQVALSLMRESLQSDIDLLNSTNDSILSHPGKHIRPMMALLIARALSGGEDLPRDTYLYACAAELLHNATLLHDDVADGSASRRGIPTVMSLLGGRASVLLGDYWLVKAMDRILQAAHSPEQVIRIFAKTLSDLAEGEMLQLQKADSGDTLETDYYRIIFNKTASLFEASALSAAISVGAAPDQKEAVRSYACHLGIAFQIRDDMLDYEGGVQMGKPVCQDLEEQKITLPLLGALNGCDAARAAEIRRQVLQIQDHPQNKEQILSFVRECNGLAYAASCLEDYIARAEDALSILAPGTARDALVSLARFVGKRRN